MCITFMFFNRFKLTCIHLKIQENLNVGEYAEDANQMWPLWSKLFGKWQKRP